MLKFGKSHAHQAAGLAGRIGWPILIGFATVICITWVLRYSAYGIDFTDESFYIIWISDPFMFDGSSTQFGFIYHPLYLLFDGDVAALRQFNLLVTYFLAWNLAFSLLKKLAPFASSTKLNSLVVSAGLSVSALLPFDNWLLTPSYNSLAFQALLIAVIGLLLVDKTQTRENFLGLVLIGLGGWLAFMAKPTTALMLAVAVLLCLTFSRKLNFRTILVPVFCVIIALTASALLIDGSILGFVERLQKGLELNASLGGGHTINQIIRLDDFLLNEHESKTFMLLTLLTFFSNWQNWSRSNSWPLVVRALSFTLYIGIMVVSVYFCARLSEFGAFKHLLLLSVALGCLLSTIYALKLKFFSALPISHWALVLFLLSIPHIYAFGTSGNYWAVGGVAGLFWILAGLVSLGAVARSEGSWKFALPMVFVPLLISSAFLYSGMDRPYRQPQPLWLNTETVEFGSSGSDLVLSSSFAAYIINAKTVAIQAGFKPGTAILDFSGQSPGIVYALEGKSPGQAWMIGGYTGSEVRALAALKSVSCETFSDAWLLIEPEGPRSLNTKILSAFGLAFPEDFQSVGKWVTNARGEWTPPIREQYLFKPTRSVREAVAACVSARNENPNQ